MSQGLQFILTVCRLLDGRNYGSRRDYDEECTKWIKLLLDLVDYNDATAPRCIKLFTDPRSKVFQYFGTSYIIPRVSAVLLHESLYSLATAQYRSSELSQEVYSECELVYGNV